MNVSLYDSVFPLPLVCIAFQSFSPSRSSFNSNSLFLSDFLSSSLHTHLFACHFPFMSITISLHFSCLSLCPRSPCPTPFLFQSQDFLILSSYHILNPLLFLFFFLPIVLPACVQDFLMHLLYIPAVFQLALLLSHHLSSHPTHFFLSNM